MKQRPRIYYTESQKALMWDRWKRGDSLQTIAQLFERNHSSIQRILAETGGIRPAQRCRSARALTLSEREEISRAVVSGESIRAVARRLQRSPSTVSREIRRNGGREAYRAVQADQHAWIRGVAPNLVSWSKAGNWPTRSPASSNCSGRPSRLLDGSDICFLVPRSTTCRTRPSIVAFTSKRAAP